MRRYVYLCDSCQRQFGNDSHINIKQAQAFVSFIGATGDWQQRNLFKQCNKELHFCDSDCMFRFFKARIIKEGDKI